MQVYVGIDWSQNKHDVAFCNAAGDILARATIPHSCDGFEKLDATRAKIDVPPDTCIVGLETAHNLLIDFLWARGYSNVYVIHPHITKNARSTYSFSGAYTDRSDAGLLAEILRIGNKRLQPWTPDLPITRHIRAKVSLVHHLTRSSVRISNRLRAVLLRYYPAPLAAFTNLDAPLTLNFIHHYPSPQALAALPYDDFYAFARLHRYPRPRKLPAVFAKLQAPQPQPAPDIAIIYQEEALTLAAMLLNTVHTKKATLKQLQTLFRQHPDHLIFDSLPGAGALLAPALLAKFGDDRNRFPSPASVQALAGTCPVTRQSGKKRSVHFRRPCDHEFRYFTQQWAMRSLVKSVWANAYLQQLLPRAHSKSHAYRCLANRWLAILWKLWQTRQPYDEQYHLRRRAERTMPKTIFLQHSHVTARG
jgi:transposase